MLLMKRNFQFSFFLKKISSYFGNIVSLKIACLLKEVIIFFPPKVRMYRFPLVCFNIDLIQSVYWFPFLALKEYFIYFLS